MAGSDGLAVLGILILVVFGGVYITGDLGSLDLPFSNQIINLVLMGVAVVSIAVYIYANFSDL